MESLLANRPLMYSLLVSAAAVVTLASGLLPDVMTQFQLVEFDSDVCRTSFCFMSAVNSQSVVCITCTV